MEVVAAIRSLVRSSPISALSFIGLSAAMLFNCGYFSQVGLHYMSLFSIQEHIVFSLSGVVVATALMSVFNALYNILTINPFRGFNIKGTFESRRSFGSFLLRSLLAVAVYSIFGSVIFFAAKRYYDIGGAELVTWFSLWAAFACILLVIAWRSKGAITNIEAVVFLGVLVILFALSGLFYGGNSVLNRDVRQSRTAKLADGRDVSVVRLGSEYSLILLGAENVMAVKTDSLKEISSKLGAPVF